MVDSLMLLQVSTMYHDATIGNAINIVLVRIIYLEKDEVSGYTQMVMIMVIMFTAACCNVFQASASKLTGFVY